MSRIKSVLYTCFFLVLWNSLNQTDFADLIQRQPEDSHIAITAVVLLEVVIKPLHTSNSGNTVEALKDWIFSISLMLNDNSGLLQLWSNFCSFVHHFYW